jgi:integrase
MPNGRKIWYVQIQGKQHRLHEDKATAFQLYYAKMLEAGQGQEAMADITYVSLAYQYLRAIENDAEISQRTYDIYNRYILDFCTWLGDAIKVAELRAATVHKWEQDEHPKAAATTRRMMLRSVHRVTRWAVEQGHLDRDPLAGMKKPESKARNTALKPAQWDAFKDWCHKTKLRTKYYWPIFDFLRHCGCRPKEARDIQAKHLNHDLRRLEFEAVESKGKRRPRVVTLLDAQYEALAVLALQHPEGPLFRDPKGRPWTESSLRTITRVATRDIGFTITPYGS